jgi:hypothetical protein
MMEIQARNQWDAPFFEKLGELRNRIHGGNPFHLRESVDDLQALFGPDAPFHRHNEWQAWLALGSDGRARGSLVASRPRDAWGTGKFIPVGWFECEHDPAIARRLFDEAAAWARARGHASLRGPIQGNFFNSYKLRLPGGGTPFYGEPTCPDYYHALFAEAGYQVSNTWDSVEIPYAEQIRVAREIMAHVGRSPESDPELRVRNVDLRRWKEELRTMHALFLDSYASMTDFMPIHFDEFERLYDSFRHLIQPELSLFIEHRGKPVGFMIAYFDPLPILLRAQRSRAPWRKLVALYRLRRNRRRLLLPYVGKVSGATAIKGVAGILVNRLLLAIEKHRQDYIACYLAEGSPSYATLPPARRHHAKYVLYAKEI